MRSCIWRVSSGSHAIDLIALCNKWIAWVGRKGWGGVSRRDNFICQPQTGNAFRFLQPLYTKILRCRQTTCPLRGPELLGRQATCIAILYEDRLHAEQLWM